MENEKLKKVDPVYMLVFILTPVIVFATVTFALVKFTDGKGGAAMVPVLLLAACVAWWVLGYKSMFKKGADKLAKSMEERGLVRNMTFNGKGCVVVVDAVHGMMGVVYAANPRKQYIFPASRVSKAWTDDGKTGSGMLEGTMRVSFRFVVDGIESRVDTFTSNTRWKMTDAKILEAISKADYMVEIIGAAKAKK